VNSCNYSFERRGEERRGEKRHLTYKVPYFEEFGDI
jgi:hypothetical protein